MRRISGVLRKEKRKRGLEREIKVLAKLVKDKKGNVQYITALMKDIAEFITYLESVVARLEGNIGVEQHIMRTILKTLGEQKRTVITMMEILSNVPEDISAKIKEEIEDLNKFIKNNFEKTVIDEGRVYKGKFTRRHYFEKLFGNLRRDVDIYRELQLVAGEEKVELEEEARFKEEIQALKPDAFTEPEFKEYEEDAIRILKYYRREFEHLFKALWDIQEQEYRNIKLIDHYLELLGELKKDRNLKIEYEVDDLHKKLTAIKAKLQLYIRRDFRQDVNADKLFVEFSNRVQEIENRLQGIILIILAFIYRNELKLIYSDPEAVKQFISGFGIYAPLVFILLQILQVVIFIIPGSVFTISGGYVFGVILGTIYSLIGIMIGSIFVFYVSRKFGRPFVEKIINPKELEHFDVFFKKRGKIALFATRLIPILFPTDVVSFSAGMTPIKFKDYILFSFLGFIPHLFILSFFGEELTHGINLVMIIILTILGFGILAYLFRHEIKVFYIKEIKEYEKKLKSIEEKSLEEIKI